ncbi:hypothetical protein DPMN_181297 [Dreissena polymorpha]|uniref:Uncharacterized protein n=1 Tax=Dreissena polymorpha TaxID=45954 RepID=A0A9D4DE63_DREPO|nr:hypothetical protein DPMN_181297 [Dreissena polymorpha]
MEFCFVGPFAKDGPKPALKKEEGWAWGWQLHPVKKMLATETTTMEQATNGARSEADQATGLMKDGDQSRKDVPTPIVELLTPKRWIRVGCWNVRTIYQTGKLAQVVSELNQTETGMDWLWQAEGEFRRSHHLVRKN